ncbi:hypothetical protein CCY99_01185 [Helicobacter sp. 16-1353]|uniref:hypothetical protein n=1 Tax=Helicobacter sp. 16-1353 TaxID=2004996 RepID=UPI000DCBB916|nr:hypothetical protein [Helicobacter sp. 16-1353]RAX55340.1 hypothetical protein CCY99_01185 [Helicobacter sp. 16-1353]
MNKNINILNKFNLKGSILSINKTNDSIVVVTQNYQAFRIDIKNIQIKNLTTLINSKYLPHKYAKNSSASDKFVCLAEVNSKIISIAKITESINLFLKLKSHKSDISASCFSKDGNYLASGGEDGRVHLYETNNFRKILSLPYRPDYISSLNFSKDSRFLFASCFNKSNIIFDTQRAKTIGIFNTNEVVEWGDFFDNNSKLFVILRNLNAIIYDTRANQVLNISSPFTSWPSIFCINDEENTAIVGSRDSTIYIINIEKNIKIFSLKLENSTGISALCLHLGYIFIGYTNGELAIISYNDKDDEFKTACENKDYKTAANLLDKNIFLSLLPCSKIFDEDWDKILKDAIELLGQNKIDEALEIVEPFTKDISKKEAFNFYLNKKDVLKKFRELIDNRFYEEAYNMTLQTKFLTKTSHFEILENIWYKSFNTAKKLLEEDSANVDIAKKHLELFLKTPKKEAIMQLLNNLHIFRDAENFVKEQKFKEYFALTSNFGYLKDTELYKKVLLLGENLFEKAMFYENKNEYDEFHKIAKFLQSFPQYKESITTCMVAVAKKIEILNLIKQNKKYDVYKLAMEFEELQYLDEFKAYCEEFNEIYQQAREMAFKGMPEALEGIFKDYIQINYWFDKIEHTFKIAYLEEFNNKIKSQDKVNWELSIKHYINIFGKDDDIVGFCVQNNFKKLLEGENDENDFREPFRFQKTLIQ